MSSSRKVKPRKLKVKKRRGTEPVDDVKDQDTEPVDDVNMDIDDPDGSQPVTMGITDFWAVINTLNPSASAPPAPDLPAPAPTKLDPAPPDPKPRKDKHTRSEKKRVEDASGVPTAVGLETALEAEPTKAGTSAGSAGRSLGAGSSKAGEAGSSKAGAAASAGASAGSSSANVQAKNPSPWDLRDAEAVIVVLGFVDEHIGIMNTVLNELLIAHEKLVRTRILSLSALEKLNHVFYAHHAELDISDTQEE
ncbi:hypothetical protein DFP72DRAFT_1074857 [Ephemerocybe angulata]|uniref:Uncharacterized protein n=1 Tax=Ephemerocybe angulata TaxID=980116 RepID=A0A8H6M0P4_9AGAR|nr:hypothetical protein DFP72DRAFT_1074857 [Tulosesus angulatus]